MAESIYTFTAALNESVRANQFQVEINFPAALVSDATGARRMSTYLTRQASLPSYRTGDVQVYYRGRIIHEAGEKEYDTWTCTMYNSADFKLRNALEEWVNAINDPEVVVGMTRPANYYGSITIKQLNREGNVLKVYVLHDVVPLDTGSIELDYSQNSDIEQFQASFAFNYMTVEKS